MMFVVCSVLFVGMCVVRGCSAFVVVRCLSLLRFVVCCSLMLPFVHCSVCEPCRLLVVVRFCLLCVLCADCCLLFDGCCVSLRTARWLLCAVGCALRAVRCSLLVVEVRRA